MTQELFYTSAPRGLRPGSRGFCTVMSTSGMAKNLADRLESLSGYRHVFAPNDPKAELNPVAYSHLRITVGGIPYHVLSRISAAGLDYTQRSNKFAHHIVLDQKERVAAGPAALLAAQGFMESTWEGEPRLCGAGRKPPASASTAGVCRHWQQVAGDAGWAGVLAETATGASARVAAIIFKPGVDTLSLVVEALALLPAPLRWQVTFSTYYTKLPPEVECQWRFVLAGSAEAKALERAQHTLTIDLSSLLGRAPDGIWAEAARTGISPKLTVAETAMPAGSAAITPMAQPLSTHAEVLGQALEVDWSLLPRGGEIGRQRPPLPGLRGIGVQRRKWLGPALLGGAVVVGCLLVMTAGALVLWPNAEIDSSVEVAQEPPKPVPILQNREMPKDVDNAAKAEDAKQVQKKKADDEKVDRDAQTENQRKQDELKKKKAEELEPRKAREEELKAANTKEAAGADTSPRREGGLTALGYFHLTEPVEKSIAVYEPEAESIEIPPQFHLKEIKDVRFQLVGGDVIFPDWTFKLVPVDPHSSDKSDDGQTSSNSVAYQIKLVPSQKRQVGAQEQAIADLKLTATTLSFKWRKLQPATKSNASGLRNCVFTISSGENTFVLALRKPTLIEPVRISFDKPVKPVQLPSERMGLPFPLEIMVPEISAFHGYLAHPAINGAIRISPPANSNLPEFTLTLNSRSRRVELICEWDLLRPPAKEKSRGRVADTLQALTGEQSDLSTKRQNIFSQRASLASGNQFRSDAHRKEIEAFDSQIEGLDGELRVVSGQIAALNSVKSWQLEGSPIPFSIAVNVNSHRVVIATTPPAPVAP